MSKLQIIVGTTRPTRSADIVLPWIAAAARAQGSFEVEILDLRDWPLPFFSEHLGSIGDINDPTYSEPIVRAWNHKIRAADAYLIVTSEYNHSLPGVLKNALDSVWAVQGFRNKPISAVGYSAGIGGGIRAIEHLVQVAVEAEAVPLRNTVVIPFVHDAFTEGGRPKNAVTEASLTVALEDLAWWADNLKRARGAGELNPGRARMHEAIRAAEDAAKRAD